MAGSWSLGKYRSMDGLKYDAIFKRHGENILAKLISGTATASPSSVADVWEGAGVRVYPVTATSHTLVSTSTEDNPSGTGAAAVKVLGLDANYLPQSEVINLDGITPINTQLSYIRVNQITTARQGSGTAIRNVGIITCSNGGDVQRVIGANLGKDSGTHYSVPAGYTGLITSLTFSVRSSFADNANREIGFLLFVESELGSAQHNVTTVRTDAISSVNIDLDIPVIIQEKEDIKIRMFALADNPSTSFLTATYSLFLAKNTFINNITNI